MKVKLRTTLAGPGGCHSAGDTVDLPTKQAQDLIAGGYAEKLEGPPVFETAMEQEPDETTDLPRGKKGKH